MVRRRRRASPLFGSMSSRILSPRSVAITSSACMRLVNELNPRTGVGGGGRGRHRRHKLKSIAVIIAAAYLVATILSCSSTSLLRLFRLSTLRSREEPLTRLVNRVVQGFGQRQRVPSKTTYKNSKTIEKKKQARIRRTPPWAAAGGWDRGLDRWRRRPTRKKKGNPAASFRARRSYYPSRSQIAGT